MARHCAISRNSRETRLDAGFAGLVVTESGRTAYMSVAAAALADLDLDLAAVNPWMVRMTAAVADGVHVRPLNSPTYHAETLLPNLRDGRGTDALDDFTASLPVFTAAGVTAEVRARWRETTPA